MRSQIWLNDFLDDCHFGYITKPLKETLVGREPPFSRNRAFGWSFGSHDLFGCGNRARFLHRIRGHESRRSASAAFDFWRGFLDPNVSCPIVFTHNIRATDRFGWGPAFISCIECEMNAKVLKVIQKKKLDYLISI